MNEKELRNNLKSLDSKFQEIKSSNDKLLRLHKEKKKLADMINHSFSVYASNYLKKDNIVIGSNISLSKVRIPFNKNNNSTELINAVYTLLVKLFPIRGMLESPFIYAYFLRDLDI